MANGEKPVLWLCPKESGNGHVEECPEADAVKSMSDEVSKGKEKKKTPSFLRLNYTCSRYKTGQLVSSRTLSQGDIFHSCFHERFV